MKTKCYKGLLTLLLLLTFFHVVGQAPILIIDLDVNSNSAPSIAASLTNLEAEFETSNSIPGDLSSYEALFICLGIYSSNYVLDETEGQLLATFLDNGGSIYMEGGDTWYYDQATSLHPKFNIIGLSDGTGDLGLINGLPGTFTDGMSFSYTGDNNWIDHLQAVSPAFNIFENQTPPYITAVAYDAGPYKTIGASHEFGGLNDGSSPSTKDELMAVYLEFLDVDLAPEANFVASDTITCENDTVAFSDLSTGNVLTWNWIFEGGMPLTSSQQNPQVLYQNAGSFDVFLEVSDGEITSTLYMHEYIQVGHVPQTANTPSGISLLCASWGNTTYTTNSLAGVSSYQWKIEPENAATLSGSGTSITVIWDAEFLGTVDLSVAGVNYCGTGVYSDPLTINRYLPDVNLILPAFVGLPDPPFPLTGGTPSGGEYSGPGVTNGIFDPAAAGIGEHTITYTYTDLNLCTNSAEDIITVTEFTGMEEYGNSDGFSFFPNPNNGIFTLKVAPGIYETVSLKLVNSVNQSIIELPALQTENGYEEGIDIRGISDGLYYLILTTPTKTVVKKMVMRK